MARLIETVIGHEENIQKLTSLKTQDRWPHAFLFVGPHSIGKKKLALAFAQMLICQKSDTACGICGPCLRVEKEQSENLILVEPDTSLAKPVIKVEAIRTVLDSLSLASLSGARVVIIDQAHQMNPQAANALLKTLEEPFENVYFFLIGPELQQFLPTIRSRCQIMGFRALAQAELKTLKPGLADWAYVASRGQLERLKQLTSADGIERRTESYELLEQFILDKMFLQNNSWRTQVKDKSWTLLTITSWLQMLYSAMMTQALDAKGTGLLSIEHTKYFNQLKEIAGEKLFQLADELVAAEKEILGNADPVLIFEKMWVHYARVG